MFCCRVVGVALCQQSEGSAPQSQSTADQPPSGSAQNSTKPPSQTQSQPQPQEPPASTSQPSQVAPKDAETAPNKPAAHPQVLPTRKKPSAKKEKKSQSGKVIVRNGGARDNSVQLNPAMTEEQILHTKENTTQLLVTTDANVKALAGRQLSPTQQSTVAQIRSYMRQSKAASASGDLARAHTLAFKAHLLSDELTRQ